MHHDLFINGTDVPVVSLVMIVKNEEADIEAALRSVEGLPGQVIVCDTGSTDRTVEIAESLGARVVHFPWNGSFADARNHAMSFARGKWIFILDADEAVRDTDFENTLANLAKLSTPPVAMVRETLLLPGGRTVTFFTPRLFLREAGIRYVYPIHEQPDYSGESVSSNVTIVHTGYADPEHLRRKETRNLELARTMPPDHPHGLHCRARSAMAVQDWPEVLEAAGSLVELAPAPIITLEGCVLGATAAYNMQRLDDAERFLETGRKLAPHSSDLRYLEILCACARYVETFDAGDSNEPGEFIRPWLFWHDQHLVALMMQVLTGKVRIAPSEDGNRLVLSQVDPETGR